MLSGAGLGVPYSDAVPRLIDVALFLCERALCVLCGTTRGRHAWAEELRRWFMTKIAFINAREIDDEARQHKETTDADPYHHTKDVPSGGSGATRRESRYMPEVDLKSAYCALHSDSRESRQSRLSCWATTAKNDVSQSAASRRGAAWSADQAMHSCAASESDAKGEDDDAGMSVLCDLLRLCLRLGGGELMRDAAQLLARPLSPKPDLGVLCALFAMPDDIQLASFMAIGSATRSFHVWVCLAWACASFRRQSVIVSATTRWARRLQRYAGDALSLSPRHCRKVSMTASCHAPDNMTSGFHTNLRQLTDVLRGVFEGKANSTETLLELLFAHPAPASLAEGYLAKLLLVQGPPAAATVARSEMANRGTQPILLHITCGMLLYVQYHLTVHDLAAAQRCAAMAILVGHQLHSNTLLALAHHSAFLVRLAAGAPREAADSVAIALQLSAELSFRLRRFGGGGVSATACAEVEVQDRGLHTSSLCYLGAAELMVFFPGTVDSALRSSLIAMAAATTRGRGGAKGGGTAESLTRADAGEGGAGSSVPSALPAAAVQWQSGTGNDAPRWWLGQGNAVVVQSVAQTVQHALCLAELEAVLHQPAGYAWVAPVTALARETVRLVAGHLYGFAATGIALHAVSVGRLSRQLRAEAAVTAPWPVAASLRPAYALLAEMTRHAAHQALVCQERGALSTAGRDNLCGPFTILRDFAQAVEEHYGADGVAFVSAHSFLGGVRDYLLASWLHARGFVAAAYATVTDLIVSLCAEAGVDAGERGGCAGVDPVSDHALRGCAAPHGAEEAGRARLCDGGVCGTPCAARGSCTRDAADEVLAKALREDDTKNLYWPPDHLLLLTYAQLLRAETACYLGYSNKLAFIHTTLNELCARHDFVLGVLASRLVDSMGLHLKNCPSAQLAALRETRSAAQQIGLRVIECKAQVQSVVAYAGGGEWREALRTLDSIDPLPLSLRTWYLLQRFNFGLELLLNDADCPGEGLAEFVSSGVEVLRGDGHLCHSATDAEILLSLTDRNSVSVSVQCLLCLHVSVARALKLVLLARTDSGSKCVDEASSLAVLEGVDVFARTLQRRQRATRCVKMMRGYTVLQLCDLVLSGDLASVVEGCDTQRGK